ncbi:MAG: ATP-binding cassette domain-containing protein, partial [Cytophagales bacterium]|nr:ATP-binding cassette domain-containing protein [Cytophagales bacterium]
GSLVIEKGELSASQFITYIIIFSQIMRPAKTISSALTGAQVGMVSGERILEILDKEISVPANTHGKKAVTLSKSIEFSQVNFSHGSHSILKNINQKFESGKMYALVGTSGGGKSTLIDLIIRYYDPNQGTIYWDGIPLPDYDLGSIRKQMGVVTQESILFNDTIYENIVFGRKDVTEADVIQAAKIANAHEFIVKTENGYQTFIGDRGIRLSGGQKQRLCIARAILQNPPILILDEATSALDTESEKLVQEALNNLLKDRTSIVIAHRLSTIQHADEILVIDKGEIVEQGSHDNLLANPNGLYNKLIKLQKL